MLFAGQTFGFLDFMLSRSYRIFIFFTENRIHIDDKIFGHSKISDVNIFGSICARDFCPKFFVFNVYLIWCIHPKEIINNKAL